MRSGDSPVVRVQRFFKTALLCIRIAKNPLEALQHTLVILVGDQITHIIHDVIEQDVTANKVFVLLHGYLDRAGSCT